MRRARRRGLAHEAADRIRESILQGTPPPGSPLREVDLAALLDVSRGSVREGLALLERDGLVVSEWHRGARVIGLTPEDADEVYAVRGALERLAAHRAATRATQAQLSALADLADALERALDGGADPAELLRLDLGFHDLLFEMAANARLVRAWEGLRSPVQLFRLARARHRPYYRRASLAEHRALVDLLARGDAEGAARHAEAHVAASRDSLITALDTVHHDNSSDLGRLT